MQVDYLSLLPTTATPWMRAVEQTSGERWADIDVDVIRRYKDAATCPAHLLNFLAHENSVDVWDDDWAEGVKRSVIASAPKDHRQKGTKAGLTRYINLAGGEALRWWLPPGTAYASAARTPEQRAAWLKNFPELRIYPQRAQAVRPRSFFAGSGYAGVASGPAGRALLPSTALGRAGRQAYLVQDGVETPLAVTVVTTMFERRVAVVEERIHLPAIRLRSLVAGIPGRAKRFAGGKRLPSVVAIAHNQDYDAIKVARRRDIVSPSYTPIDATPVKTFGRAFLPKSKFYAGVSAASTGRFVIPSTAFLRVYETTWLYTPGSAQPKPIRNVLYAGRSRLGHADYTAEIKVRIRAARKSRSFFAGWFAGSSFAYPASKFRTNKVLQSVSSAKAMRDQIYINLNCSDVVRCSPNVRAGDVVCGQIMETI